jgi:phosphoserine aminotransferase
MHGPMTRPMNFNAGPAALPLAALERARDELLDFAGTGISVMEHSHRGKEYEAVHDEAMSLLRELLSIPNDYEVLFLQGGASAQFAFIPMSFLPKGASADYIVTGAWSAKAHAEAVAWSHVAGGAARVAASTEASGFTRVARPEPAELDSRAAYVHFASNETIHGVQYLTLPHFGAAPHVCDMSSDFLSRKVDVSSFALIYGGAQKNVGPSGVTIVIARRAFIDAGRKDLPAILQYRSHAANKSLLNTPPTFGIYLARNVLLWLKEGGGLEAIEARNRAKAAELYAALDASPVHHERRLPPADGRPRAKVSGRSEEERHARAQRAPQRRRHPRLALQCRRALVGLRPGLVRQRLRPPQRVSGNAHDRGRG